MLLFLYTILGLLVLYPLWIILSRKNVDQIYTQARTILLKTVISSGVFILFPLLTPFLSRAGDNSASELSPLLQIGLFIYIIVSNIRYYNKTNGNNVNGAESSIQPSAGVAQGMSVFLMVVVVIIVLLLAIGMYAMRGFGAG